MRIIPCRLFFLSFSIKTKFGNLQKIRFMSRVLFVCKDNIVNTYVHSIFTSKAILRTARKTKYVRYYYLCILLFRQFTFIWYIYVRTFFRIFYIVATKLKLDHIWYFQHNKSPQVISPKISEISKIFSRF